MIRCVRRSDRKRAARQDQEAQIYVAFNTMIQAQLFEIEKDLPLAVEPKHTTHSGGRGEPFHDWYPYLEGFSPEFVKSILEKYIPGAQRIIEPFAGTGTTPVVLSALGIVCGYCEVNPAMQHIISTKMAIGQLARSERIDLSAQIIDLGNNLQRYLQNSTEDKSLVESYFRNFEKSKFFNENTFKTLLKLRTLNNEISLKNEVLGSVLSVSVMSKIVTCSLLKRAGDVRYKTEKELLKGVPELLAEVSRHLVTIAKDCVEIDTLKGRVELIAANAKNISNDFGYLADGVITSPPYLNGTNYFRNTKLELWYGNYLNKQNTLRTFRNQAITSGINDVAKEQGRVLINDRVRDLVGRLEENSYDQRIPRMVAGYFEDMRNVMVALKNNCRIGGTICIDIGDSRYGGVHVPTHDILAVIGQEVGLRHIETVRLRTRISKDKTKLSQSLIVLRK